MGDGSRRTVVAPIGYDVNALKMSLDSSDAEDPDGEEDEEGEDDGILSFFMKGSREVVTGSYLNILVIGIPIALCAKFYQWDESWTFMASMIALVPCAERISFVTEDVAKYTNSTVGGLLNASFGNITELVVCIFAIKAGLLRVVQLSMLGSVLSNLLLVLGSAFMIGGIRYKEQSFNMTATNTYTGLLNLAVLALSLPTILDATHKGAGGSHEEIVHLNHSVSSPSWLTANGDLEAEDRPGGDAPLWYSRFIAVVMLVMYASSVVFQLVTHNSLFEDGEDDEDDEPGVLGLWGGIFWLGVLTVFISVLSDFLVDAIQGAAESMGLPILFVSGILVPIVGNAAEHAAALTFAYKNKMAIALGSSVGSAVQISVFVIPLCVLIGWFEDKPLTMNYHSFETATMLLTSMSVAILLMDGKSNWLKGAILILEYLMIAAGFYAHANPASMA